MDILKAEIARKRKQLDAQRLTGPDKKYFKREELLKQSEDEYWSKEMVKKGFSSREEELKKEASASASSSSSTPSTHSKNAGDEERVLPRKEVVRRLREYGEAVLLFGETEADAYRRLKHKELVEPESNRGFRNDFQEAMEQVDQAYLNEILKSGGNHSEAEKVNANDVKVDEMETDLEDIKRLATSLGKKRDDIKHDCDIISTFMRFILNLWGKRLNSRPESEKMSTAGKVASATYSQTQAYLKPLFKQLKTNKVAEDILKHLILIVKFLLERNYVKASDAYLQMAIGNSPWPIGVTMVGIHARTGREKIFSQNIAHVLNDETQRKYIQGLKRIITQCQRLFPTDPSRCVEYNA